MRRIGLLGATGYTGRLTATEFALREMPVRLGGRSADRLARVDAIDGSERVVVDTTNRATLDRFLDGLDVVISTVGPFEDLGRPVVDAAVAAGVHYVDSTGEPDFMSWCYDRHTDAATAVVPACGYDYVPSDCAAAIAAAALGGPPTEITIGYTLRGVRPTRGTARSALGAVLATPKPGLRRTSVGGRPAVEVPTGDLLTTGRWAGATVRCAVTVPRVTSVVGPAVATVATPLLRLGGPVLRRLVERMPEGPSETNRSKARATVTATASRAGETASVAVDVSDIYAMTALSLVEFALRVEGAGALSPAQAVDPEAMLDALTGPLLSWRKA